MWIPLEQVQCLRPLQKQLLQQCCGAVYCHEILSTMTSSQIAAKCAGQIDAAEADSILDALKEHCSRETLVPIRKLLAQEAVRDSKRIATFSRELDGLLGGGVALGVLTEFCGAPGAGKTQLSLQLGVSCFLPQVFGGIQTDDQHTLTCWYIDTEGSFSSSRFREVASAAVAQVTRIANQQHWHTSMTADDVTLMRNAASTFSVEFILKNTHVSRVCDVEPFLALIYSLPLMLRDSPSVKLIVIDSIAFPFRSAASGEHSAFSDPSALHRALFHVGHILGKIAAEFNVSVIVTNQMTTRVSPAGDGAFGASELVPALGDSWAHCVGTRVILRAPTVPSVAFSNDNGAAQLRYAELVKSPTELWGDCSFLVCGAGVRNASR